MKDHVFKAIYFLSLLAHRNFCVISKILKSEVPNLPPSHVGASKEEEGVNVVRKWEPGGSGKWLRWADRLTAPCYHLLCRTSYRGVALLLCTLTDFNSSPNLSL
jgi:hypothetical protein